MITIFSPTPPTPEPAILGHRMSIALRQIGPKSAFLTNRIGNAYARHPPAPSRSLVRKKHPSTHGFSKVHLKLKEPVPVPQQDEELLVPVETCDDDKVLAVVERGVVPTAPASLAPEAAPDEATERRCVLTLEANSELERTTATDEMRESINETLKGLHAGVLCTWRQMIGAVILLLMQRKIPMDAIRLLTQERYKVFYVKGLYYGDFIGRWVYVEITAGAVPVEGIVCAYHAFDGFVVQYLDDDEIRTVTVGHNTTWAWAGARAHGGA